MKFSTMRKAWSKKNLLLLLLLPVFCYLIVGCTGSNHAATTQANVLPNVIAPSAQTPETGTNGNAAAQAVPVQIRYALPESLQSLTTRRLQYIGPFNTSINITVTPLGGSTTSTGFTSCSPITCVINFVATPGPNTLGFTLTDGTNTLSTFSTTVIVQPSTLNTFNFSANPVVNSVTLSLASGGVVNAGAPASLVLTVNAIDAHGSTIVGNGNFVDANGNPLALLLNVSNSQGGKGNISIQGPQRIANAGYAKITANYDGNWLASSTISVTSTSPSVSSLGTVTLTTTPHATEYSTGITAGSLVQNIVTGPDGNLWFTEQTGGRIGQVTPAGIINEFSTGMTAGAHPQFITNGTDGNLWFNESAANKIGRITTSGSITEFSTGLTAAAGPSSIAMGPDGNLWFTENIANKIARITPTGTITEFSTGITAAASLNGICNGPDGNLWFVEKGSNKIGRITPSGIITEFSTGITAAAGPVVITSGPDGNLWFTEQFINRIGRITPQGSIQEFSTGISAGADLFGITTGPDGNLWFMEELGKQIAQITPSGVVTEYSSGFTAASQPYAVTTGPDGNLWFTEQAGNRVGKFVL